MIAESYITGSTSQDSYAPFYEVDPQQIIEALDDENTTAGGKDIGELVQEIFTSLFESCDKSLEEHYRLPNRESLGNINLHKRLRRIRKQIINQFEDSENLSGPATTINNLAYSIVTHILGNAVNDITNHFMLNKTLAILYMNPEHTNKIKEKIKQDCIKIYIELENLILNKSPLLQYYIHKYYIEKTELTDAELDIQRMEELKKIVLGIISMVEGTGVIYTNEPSAQQI